jgi:hypothetical protein
VSGLVKEGEEVVYKKCFVDASGEIVCMAGPIKGRPEREAPLADILDNFEDIIAEDHFAIIKLKEKIKS